MAAHSRRNDLFQPNLSGSRVRESLLNSSKGTTGAWESWHHPILKTCTDFSQWPTRYWGPQWSAVFVFYCRITQWLQITHMYHLTVSVGQKSKHGVVQSHGSVVQWCSWILYSGSNKAEIKASAGLCSFLELGVVAVGWKPLFSCWLVASDHCQLLEAALRP